jgi:hypothetical protein
LQVQPELRAHPEEFFEAQGRIDRNCALPVDNFADAALRHPEAFGEPILSHAERFQELLQQKASWVKGGKPWRIGIDNVRKIQMLGVFPGVAHADPPQ